MFCLRVAPDRGGERQRRTPPSLGSRLSGQRRAFFFGDTRAVPPRKTGVETAAFRSLAASRSRFGQPNDSLRPFCHSASSTSFHLAPRPASSKSSSKACRSGPAACRRRFFVFTEFLLVPSIWHGWRVSPLLVWRCVNVVVCFSATSGSLALVSPVTGVDRVFLRAFPHSDWLSFRFSSPRRGSIVGHRVFFLAPVDRWERSHVCNDHRARRLGRLPGFSTEFFFCRLALASRRSRRPVASISRELARFFKNSKKKEKEKERKKIGRKPQIMARRCRRLVFGMDSFSFLVISIVGRVSITQFCGQSSGKGNPLTFPQNSNVFFFWQRHFSPIFPYRNRNVAR